METFSVLTCHHNGPTLVRNRKFFILYFTESPVKSVTSPTVTAVSKYCIRVTSSDGWVVKVFGLVEEPKSPTPVKKSVRSTWSGLGILVTKTDVSPSILVTHHCSTLMTGSPGSFTLETLVYHLVTLETRVTLVYHLVGRFLLKRTPNLGHFKRNDPKSK